MADAPLLQAPPGAGHPLQAPPEARLPVKAPPGAHHALQHPPAHSLAAPVPLANHWFMLAALLTVAVSTPGRPSAGGEGAGGSGSGPPTSSEPGATPGPPPKPAAAPHRRQSNLYAINQRYRRQISSATDLRFLHIPRFMAEPLIPDIAAYQVARPGRKKAPIRLSGAGRPVFVSQAILLDTDGRDWPVLYRTYVTGKQYHRRLTDGWRPFVTHHGLAPGDGIMFWRQARDERAGALVMRVQVVRGGGGGGGA